MCLLIQRLKQTYGRRMMRAFIMVIIKSAEKRTVLFTSLVTGIGFIDTTAGCGFAIRPNS